jgi:hypothetical protein
MILSHTHQFVFISNGKTGTSSVERALEQYHEGEEFEVGVDGLYDGKHVPPSVLRAQLGKQIWDRYFTFCFVRNPWDWFVSQYFWNWQPDPVSRKAAIKHPIQTFREFRSKQDRRQRLTDKDQFSKEDIRRTYCHLKQYRAVYEADSLFQYYYAYSTDGEKLVDAVGRFENIETDFRKIARHIGLEAELPHRNRTNHRPSSSYYTESTASLIADLYAIDINEFGYRSPLDP